MIPRSSLLGPIDHGSPPGCNAAPAEKASTAQYQTSSQTLDEILRRAKLRVSPEQAGTESRAPTNPPGLNADNFAQQSAHFSGRSPIQAVPVANAAGATSGEIPTEYARPSGADDRCHYPAISAFAPESRPHPTFPCQISYDTRTVPSGTGPSRWYDAMLGRANFVGGNAGIPIVQRSTGTFTLAPTVPVTMTVGSRNNVGHQPSMPTFAARTSAPYPSAAPPAAWADQCSWWRERCLWWRWVSARWQCPAREWIWRRWSAQWSTRWPARWRWSWWRRWRPWRPRSSNDSAQWAALRA